MIDQRELPTYQQLFYIPYVIPIFIVGSNGIND